LFIFSLAVTLFLPLFPFSPALLSSKIRSIKMQIRRQSLMGFMAGALLVVVFGRTADVRHDSAPTAKPAVPVVVAQPPIVIPPPWVEPLPPRNMRGYNAASPIWVSYYQKRGSRGHGARHVLQEAPATE
jgi:hypothetical protein